MKKVFIVLFLSVFVLLFPFPVNADSNFITSFDITYTINENGLTHAVFTGLLQNTTDKYYASSYTLNIGFNDVEHLQASDVYGKIMPSLTKTAGGNAVFLPLNKRAIGRNNKTSFSFSFDTTNVANHIGSIWEVNIPGLANQADFKDFTVHIRVPSSFGDPAYIKPVHSGPPLDFDKTLLGTAGISIAFGQTQAYQFMLSYHLKNPNLFPLTTTITLPPTTNYQEILLQDISPKPTNVTLDTDGNWIASYSLLPSQKIDVTTKGIAFVSFAPKKEILTQQQKQLYLRKQQYWETDSEDIIRLAKDLKTPQNIFDYVVHHLQYDFSRVTDTQKRLGAEKVLENPQSAVCLEFSDLFIGIARAAGIPSREIDGFAYTENTLERPLSLVKDILHAWPEYYDTNQQAWIMVDPTWENTTRGTDYFHTLDFDHIAFSIEGAKSTYPIPAGGYKLPADTKKDVSMAFALDAKLMNPQITVAFDSAPSFFSGTSANGTLTITNVSQRMAPPQEITIDTSFLKPHSQKIMTQGIPPFGFIKVPITFENTFFLTNTKDIITIHVAGNTITKKISVFPIFFQNEYLYGGIFIAVLSIFLFIVATRTWRLFIAGRKR